MAKGLSIADLIEKIKLQQMLKAMDKSMVTEQEAGTSWQNWSPLDKLPINSPNFREIAEPWNPNTVVPPPVAEPHRPGDNRFYREDFPRRRKWRRDGIGISPEMTPEQEAITRENERRMREAMPKITFPHKWMGRLYNEQEWEALQKRMREHRQRQSERYSKKWGLPIQLL